MIVLIISASQSRSTSGVENSNSLAAIGVDRWFNDM